ncbi:MAG: L,D-transpeptidase [Cyanobacteria bacterium P01_A01_bin.45]
MQNYNTIGGQVGIHGVPPQSDRMIDDRKNWTWGCLSLKNQNVDELYQVVKVLDFSGSDSLIFE